MTMSRTHTCRGAAVSLATVILAMLVAVITPRADGADVSMSVSDRRVYVGVPFTVSIVIGNYRRYDAPAMKPIDGLTLLSGPSESTSSFTQIINGQITQRQTVTLSYQFVAGSPGVFTIPSVTVSADGEEHQTPPVRITAVKSEIGGLLDVEVLAADTTYYLGQTLQLKLEIWLRPYRDARTGRMLDRRAMANMLNLRGSTLGVFAQGLNDMTARHDERANDEGEPVAYYVYEVSATLTPQQSGFLTFDEVRVRVDYPTGSQRRRSFFDDGYSSRPLVATARSPLIEIVPPPDEGRPPTFAGAVGRFDFTVTAKPTSVAVGDPITLTLTIDDESQPPTDLAVLSPPPLEEVPALVADFRIAGDPPAGRVPAPRRKTFTQTIRATTADVTRIPAIPFAYFNPDLEQYATVVSDPITIDVRPATQLADSEIVGGEISRNGAATELTEVAGGILANYTGDDLLLASHVFAFSWPQVAAVAVPPVTFGLFALGHRRVRRRRDDGSHVRRRRAGRRALKRLVEAQRAEPARQAQVTVSALSDYVADHCNLPAGALTGTEVIERLRSRGVDPTLVEETASLLAVCEQLRYAGGGEAESDSIAQRAARCIERLERERIA